MLEEPGDLRRVREVDTTPCGVSLNFIPGRQDGSAQTAFIRRRAAKESLANLRPSDSLAASWMRLQFSEVDNFLVRRRRNFEPVGINQFRLKPDR